MNKFNVGFWLTVFTAVFVSVTRDVDNNPAFWVCVIILCFLFQHMLGWYKPKA